MNAKIHYGRLASHEFSKNRIFHMNSIDLETPICPMCGCTVSIVRYFGKGFDPYSIRSCTQCSLSFLSPRPTERAMLSLYQEDDYFSGEEQGYVNYAAQEHALRATFHRLLMYLAVQKRTGGNLLEVGCGYGYLLDEARPYFMLRVGTDFSAGAVEQARMRADQVFKGGISSVDDQLVFDCIIAAHVIEHVYHPHNFVNEAIRRLRPGGTLLLAAPDFGSYWRKLMGYRWPSFKLPEHILYFDKRTLPHLLALGGLKNIQSVPYPHAFPFGLIASKLGIRLHDIWNKYNLWLPATTVAFLGRKAS